MTTIRQANASDCEAIQDCARAAYELYVERIGKAPAPMVADFKSHISAGQAYVMLDAKQLIGYAICYGIDDAFQLENIAIEPRIQSQGFGRKLIEYVHALARDQGFDAVTLYTNEKMTENLDWYIRLGYTETERRHEDGFNRVYFRKQL